MRVKNKLTEIVGNMLAKLREEPEHYDFPPEDFPCKVILEFQKKQE